jgi:hypothetical protein
VLFHVHRADINKTKRSLECLADFMEKNAVVGIFIEDGGSGNLTNTLARQVQDLLPTGWVELPITAAFAGGIAKYRLRSVENFLRGRLINLNWRNALFLPFIGLFWSFFSILTAINNVLHKRVYKAPPHYCTSVFLELHRQSIPAIDVPAAQRRNAARRSGRNAVFPEQGPATRRPGPL